MSSDSPITARDPAVAAESSDHRRYRCSLVIPTKNGGELFRRVVHGLQAQTCWHDVEFIVVDSGSTDETVSIARAAGATVYSIPPDEFNHGLTRDYGVARATSDYVVLMVQDAIPADSIMIKRLLSALQEEGVAGAYAQQIPQLTADIITKRNVNTALTGGWQRKVKVIEDLDHYDKLLPIEKFHFCNFDNVCSAINKHVWKLEQFGAISFGEDIVWAERVLKRGFKIVYEPAAAVIHSHSRSLVYDYKRTYISHRLLYRLFRLDLVPSGRRLLRVWLGASILDMLYVIRMEKSVWQKLRTLTMIPITRLFSAIAQYRAVRDERHGISRNVRAA